MAFRGRPAVGARGPRGPGAGAAGKGSLLGDEAWAIGGVAAGVLAVR
jgi:hypothetical protein